MLNIKVCKPSVKHMTNVRESGVIINVANIIKNNRIANWQFLAYNPISYHEQRYDQFDKIKSGGAF